jgi:S-layer protein
MATAADYAAVVQQLYVSYFGRPADPYGAANFAAQLATLGAPTTFKELNAAVQADTAHTTGLSQLVNSFNVAQESIDLYGTDNSQLGISKFVEAVYKNILGRSPDFDGGNFWIKAITDGILTKANAAAAITQAALENTSAQGLLDAKTVANKLTVATDFTDTLKTDISKTNAYSGNDAAATGRGLLTGVSDTTDTTAYHATVTSTVDVLVQATVPHTSFTLTAGVDTPVSTAGNDVFNAGLAVDPSSGNATVATLSSFDVIDGGAGSDTLNAFFTGTVTGAPAATVKNVEIVNIYNDAALTANYSAWTGVTNLNVSGAATFAVDVTSAAAAVSVAAGSTVKVTDAGATTKTVSISGNTGAATITGKAIATVSLSDTDQAVSIVNNAASGNTALTLNVDGVTAAAAVTDTNNKYKSVTVNATSDSDVAVLSTSLTSATLTGSGELTIDLTGATKLATVTISGSGGVISDLSAATVTKVDASASTGTNDITVDGTAATYTGGAGNDTVHLAAAPTKAINGGAGANVLDLAAIADLSTLTKTLLANATNFQTLQLSGAVGGAAAAGILDVSALSSTFTGVTVNTNTDAANLTFKNVASGFSFTELDSQAFGSTITLKTDGKADVLNLVLGNGDSVALDETAVGITAATFETINVAAHADVSGGAVAHKAALIIGEATTLNVTGEAGVDFTGSTLTKVATVAAGASTGDITIALTVTDGSTVTTGSGADHITTAAAAGEVDTINTGTGSDTVTVVDGDNVITFGGGAKAVATLTAGDGDNTVTVNGTGTSALTLGDGNNTITGAAGVNTITVGNGTNTVTVGAGDDVITVGTGANVLTLGAGADTVAFSAAAASSAVFTTIKDIASTDVLDFSGVHAVVNANGKLGAAITSGVNDYQTFLNQAVHSGTAGTVSWFQFGGDTYIVEEVGTTGSFVAGTDQVVKLTGLVDLKAAVVDNTAGTITLA